MSVLGIDVGGANLKAADGLGFALTRPFALWRNSEGLASEVSQLLQRSPPAQRLALTMTGELADCFETKAEGVTHIVRAVEEAARGPILVYSVEGHWITPEEALADPYRAAASNWHALGAFAARHSPTGAGLLVDAGSTTTDLVPFVNGRVAATGSTDTERLIAGELVYTGVIRSPLAAVVATLPWRQAQCPTAHEYFASTLDAYLVLGLIEEQADNGSTADGRPATAAYSRDRLARSICADRTTFSLDDARLAAEAVLQAQAARIGVAAQRIVRNLPERPNTMVISGRGEFLARRVVERLRIDCRLVSLNEQLGPAVSTAATAHALAVLAREYAG
jgi:hypothetical protein